MMTEKQISKTPFLYLSLGFISGVIVARNAAPLQTTSQGGIVIGILLLAWFMNRAGKRGKAEAVAVATATAIASATATAQATAQQAVQIVLQQAQRPTHPELESWEDAWELASSQQQHEISQDFDRSLKSMTSRADGSRVNLPKERTS